MPYIAVNVSRVLNEQEKEAIKTGLCLLYTSPSPRDS